MDINLNENNLHDTVLQDIRGSLPDLYPADIVNLVLANDNKRSFQKLQILDLICALFKNYDHFKYGEVIHQL